MPPFIMDVVKLVSATIGGMVLMGSVYSGFVTLVGGRVVPWLSEKEVQMMITASVQDLRDDANMQLCQDYTDRLVRARMALVRNPEDMTAQDLLFVSTQKILTIPGCKF